VAAIFRQHDLAKQVPHKEVCFSKGQLLAVLVNLRVLRGMLLPKCLIGLARLPLVEGQVDALSPNFAQQSSAAIVRVAPEQLDPLSLRPVNCSNNTSHPDLTSNSHRVTNKAVPSPASRMLATLLKNLKS
jgi:hypothetical protein